MTYNRTRFWKNGYARRYSGDMLSPYKLRHFLAPEKDVMSLFRSICLLEFCSPLFGLLNGYVRPSDFRYFFDFLSPILDAFFFTVSSERPNLAAILAVGLFGKSFLSKVISLIDHKRLTIFFFAIVQILSPSGLLTTVNFDIL
jgi:hypothetical protein